MSIVLLNTFTIAQPRRTDRAHHGLVGQVRSVVEEGSYLSGSPDKPIEGRRYRVRSTTYDPSGDINEEILYGGLSGSDIVERRLERYDSNAVKMQKSFMGGGIGGPGSDRPTLTAADRGEDGSLITKHVFKFDSQGKILEESVYRGGGAFLYRDIYKYDSNGRRTEWIEESAGPSEKTAYSYAGDGIFPTSETSADRRRLNYSYEFDSHGNWIKRVGLFEKPTATQFGEVRYRSISYYDSIPTRDASTSDTRPTTYCIVPAGMVPDVPYDVVATTAPPKSPPPGVVCKTGIVIPGRAIERFQAAYPTAARVARIEGVVNVEVIIDEAGVVIHARAISGHPLLRESAEAAAKQWKFSPTTIDGNAVKALGAVALNFRL